MDTADISRYIKHPNDGFKLQAFTSLIQKLEKEKDAGQLRNYFELLFEASQSSSPLIADSACQWVSKIARKVKLDETDSSLSHVLIQSFKDITQFFTDIFSCIKKAHHPFYLGRLAFDLVYLQQNEIEVENVNNLFGFFQVFLRLYNLVPNSIEDIIAFLVEKPKDILRIIHHKEFPPHLIDWLIKKGFIESFSNQRQRQAFFECITSKFSHRNIYLLENQEKDLDLAPLFFENIYLFKKFPQITIFKSSTDDDDDNKNKYDFEIGETIIKSSMDSFEILNDKGLIHPSPILILPLFIFITQFNQINRCLCLSNDETTKNDLVNELRELFQKSMQINYEKPKISEHQQQQKNSQTITEWFYWIIENKKIDALLNQWKHFKNSSDSNNNFFNSLQSLLILFAFFPFVKESKETCETLLEIIKISCNEINETLIVNFHFCHFPTSTIENKKKLLRNLSKIKVNDFLTKQILKFISSCSSSVESVDIYDAVAIIFERNDWIFNEIEFQTMINITKNDKAIDLKNTKFKLIKLACLTESGEKLIKLVIGWIQDRPDLLTDAVECITNLSQIEMIEIEKLRSILKSKVYKPGNEAALSEYCKFLATSVIDSDEFDLAISCAEELWKLKDPHYPVIVRKAVYESLSKFSIHHLPETLVEENQQNPNAAPAFLSGEQVFQGIPSIDDENKVGFDETLKGFEKFLKKALSIDVNQLSRKLFISQQFGGGDTPLFIALIPVLRESLGGVGNEWKCLGLIEPLTRALLPASKKVTRCTQIIQAAIGKESWKLTDSLYNSLKHFVALRNAIDTLFHNTIEANLAINKKLDCFDATKSIINLFVVQSSKQQQSTDDGLSNALIGFAFIFKILQDYVLSQAASNPLKQAFLEESFQVIAKIRKQFLDVYVSMIDEKWEVLEKNDVLFPQKMNEPVSEETKILAAFSGKLIKYWSYENFSSEEIAAFAIFDSYLGSFNSKHWISEFINGLSPTDNSISATTKFSPLSKLVNSLANRELRSNESLVPAIKNDIKTLKLFTQFFGFDPILSQIIQEKTFSLDSEAPTTSAAAESKFTSIQDSQIISEHWNAFYDLSDSLHLKYASQLSKRIEKIIKKDKSSSKDCVEFFADYCVIFHSDIKKRKRFPSDYSNLPEKSVLRVAIEKAKSTKNIFLRETILQSIIDLKRSDSDAAYRIPPLDWASLNFHIEIENPNILRALFIIGLQQSDLRLIYKFIKNSILKDDDILAMEDKIAESLLSEFSKLPVYAFIDLIKYFVETFASVNWKKSNGSIPKAFCELAEKRLEVRKILSTNFGIFENASKLNLPFFKYFCHVKDIASSLDNSKLAKLWIELTKNDRMDLVNIFQIMKMMDENERSEAFIVMVAWFRNEYSSDLKLRLLKKLDQLSSSPQLNPEHAFIIFAALIIAEMNDSFPLELLDEKEPSSSKKQKEILFSFLPTKLKNFKHREIAAKILVKIFNQRQKNDEFEFFERKIGIKSLRISVDKYPSIVGSISSMLLNEMLELL